jgi:hypothetical protein
MQELETPRTQDMLVVWLGPWKYFAPGSKGRQFKKFQSKSRGQGIRYVVGGGSMSGAIGVRSGGVPGLSACDLRNVFSNWMPENGL